MQRSQIERLLPHVIRRAIQPGAPMDAILASMARLLAPVTDVLDHVEIYFNPYTTPDRFVPYLGDWVDLHRVWESSGPGERPDPAATPGLGRFRELIAAAAALSRWRGTAQGLIRFLETATGAQGVRIEDPALGPDGAPVPFSFRVQVSNEFVEHERLIRRIVESEKPAYVTYELVFVPPPPDPERVGPIREEV